jgi:hypothetical protein
LCSFLSTVADQLFICNTTAFVARPGFFLDPLFMQPDVVGGDMREVARSIIAREVV